MADQELTLYTNYYLNQAGGGFDVYSGAPYVKGHGLGSFLGGVFRAVFPMLKKGSQHLLKEAGRAGLNIMDDLEGDQDFKSVFKRRGMEGLRNLQKQAFEGMAGSGYNYGRKRKAYAQLRSKPPAKRTKRKTATKSRKTTKKTTKKTKKSKRKASRKRDAFD
jgi:hypothetical protein